MAAGWEGEGSLAAAVRRTNLADGRTVHLTTSTSVVRRVDAVADGTSVEDVVEALLRGVLVDERGRGPEDALLHHREDSIDRPALRGIEVADTVVDRTVPGRLGVVSGASGHYDCMSGFDSRAEEGERNDPVGSRGSRAHRDVTQTHLAPSGTRPIADDGDVEGTIHGDDDLLDGFCTHGLLPFDDP